MSRVGKRPVSIPAGVDVQIKEHQISVKAAGGKPAVERGFDHVLEFFCPDDLSGWWNCGLTG